MLLDGPKTRNNGHTDISVALRYEGNVRIYVHAIR